jgi:hypothetical protein
MTTPLDAPGAPNSALSMLDDYVRGHQTDKEASGYEEALFERALAANAPELGFRTGLSGTLREMDVRGTINVWITSKQVNEMQAKGLRLALYELDLVNLREPVIPDDVDLFITRIPVDLTGVQRIDVEVFSDTGRVLKRMPDVHFDVADGAIYACCEAELARTAAAANRLTRLWATREGERTLLLEVPSV